MIEAGVNAKALSTFMGHGLDHDHARSVRAPFSRLENDAADLLDAYLDRANTKARLAAITG